MIRAFSLDHKVIGIQYAITSMVFLLLGFTLMLVIRWQLAYPATPVPLVGPLFGPSNAPGGVLLPEFYNQLGVTHGTPTRQGTYEVACSQLCGLGHYRMRAVVRVVSSEEFARWLRQSR